MTLNLVMHFIWYAIAGDAAGLLLIAAVALASDHADSIHNSIIGRTWLWLTRSHRNT